MTNANPREIEKFTKDAPRWWDEGGPFAPLHRLNPVRMAYIKSQICAHYRRGADALRALEGVSILDVGCGGGLVCEPLARMGADVTGADADPVAIEVAREHAKQSELKIEYKNQTTGQLLHSLRKQGYFETSPDPRLRGDDSEGRKNNHTTFDIVLALEIIEHIDNPATFVKECAALVKPGGIVIFSTLNRTAKSYALGIVAAEYILRWVPAGTHEWKKFIRPSELARHARGAGLREKEISGLVYNPLTREFSMSKTDMDVNYFMVFTAPEAT